MREFCTSFDGLGSGTVVSCLADTFHTMEKVIDDYQKGRITETMMVGLLRPLVETADVYYQYLDSKVWKIGE